MTTTAGEVIQKALKRILVAAADAAPEPDEYADALDDLNNLMLNLESDNCRLGWTVVDNVSDVLTVPRGAILPIINNLAVTVAPDYSAEIPPALAQAASMGMASLLRMGRQKVNLMYPSTLPLGSGNSNSYPGRTADSQQYFGATYYGLLSFADSALTTDIVTDDVPVKVNAEWDQVRFDGLRGDISGRIINTSKTSFLVTVKVDGYATGTGAYTFRLYHNGVSVATDTETLSTTPVAFSIQTSLTLNPSDTLELWVEADGHTVDLVVKDCQFEVG